MVMKLKSPNVLYWIDGPIITPEQQQDAFQYGPNVKIRNAQHDTKDGALEPHDAVAGPAIPERYTRDDSVHKRPLAKPYADWLKEQGPQTEDQSEEFGSDTESGADRLSNTKISPKGKKAMNKAPSAAAGDQAGATSTDFAPGAVWPSDETKQ